MIMMNWWKNPWQQQSKSLDINMEKWTGDQTMDFTNNIAGTSVNLPI